MTFLIPTKTQRPWSPPVGFQCVYESYFQNETRLWFTIPRLITSYVRRRDAVISQFLNGSFRLPVALLVMAAEIDVSMNVRAFEELTYLKSMGGRVVLDPNEAELQRYRRASQQDEQLAVFLLLR